MGWSAPMNSPSARPCSTADATWHVIESTKGTFWQRAWPHERLECTRLGGTSGGRLGQLHVRMEQRTPGSSCDWAKYGKATWPARAQKWKIHAPLRSHAMRCRCTRGSANQIALLGRP